MSARGRKAPDGSAPGGDVEESRRSRRLSDRLLARMIRLYPREFRREFAESLQNDVQALRARSSDQSVALRFDLWIRLVADVVRSATAQRIRSTREALSEIRPLSVLESASFRGWLKRPGVTAGMVACSAVGVFVATLGINFAVTCLFPDVDFPNADRVVQVWQTGVASAGEYGSDDRDASVAFTSALEQRSDVFSAVYRYSVDVRAAFDLGSQDFESGVAVSRGALSDLGYRARIGRLFTRAEDDPDAERVTVLSFDWWKSRFGGDPGVIGRVIQLETYSGARWDYTVVGVLDSASVFPPTNGRLPRFYIPLGNPLADSAVVRGPMEALAVIASGKSRSEALAAAKTVGARVGAGDRELERARHTAERPYELPSVPPAADLGPLRSEQVSDMGFIVFVLVVLGIALSVLSIGAFNVASLALARTDARRAEIAIRAALGASAGSLALAIVMEVALLVLVGGAVGVAASAYTTHRLLQMFGSPFDMILHEIDVRVAAAALTVTLLSGVAAAAWPALGVLRSDPHSSIRRRSTWSGVPGEGGLRRIIGWQAGVTTALVIAAVAFSGTARRLERLDRGFDASGVAFAHVVIPETESGGGRVAALNAALASLSTLPGVEAASVGELPLQFVLNGSRGIATEDGVEIRGLNWVNPVFESYFDVMGIRLTSGRTMTAEEVRQGAPVAVVSASFESRQWPGKDPLGRSLRVHRAEEDDAVVQVIGVTEDVTVIIGRDVGQVFVPYGLVPKVAAEVFVRSSGPVEGLAEQLGTTLGASGAAIEVRETGSLQTAIRNTSFPIAGGVMSALSIIALTFAVAGLYGTMAYVIGHRRREIGVRMALGASRSNVLMVFLKGAAIPVGAGVLIASAAGVAMLMWLARGGTLTAVVPRPMATVLPVALLMITVGLAAALHPALSASRTDPSGPLREE